MLGKLMKYEWKSISKIGCLLLAVMAGITLLAVVIFIRPCFRESLWEWMI